MAKRLFEAYPANDYDHPDEALATMVTVLKGYSPDVVNHVTNPETGLQRTCKFPPRVAELVSACDAEVSRRVQADRFRNWGRGNAVDQLPDHSNRPTYDQLKEKYGENFGLNPLGDNGKPKERWWKTREELAANYPHVNLDSIRNIGEKADFKKPE